MKKKLVEYAIQEFIKGNSNLAISQLTKYIKDNQGDFIAIYNLGYMFQQLNKIEESLKLYSEVTKLNSDHWESRINIAIILIKLEKYEAALKYINEVLNIKKNYQPALRDKAFIFYKLKYYNEALKIINLSISLNTLDYLALNTKGLILLEKTKFFEAIKTFNQAIKLNNKYASSYNNLGRCLELINDSENSLKNFLTAKKLDPQSSIYINNVASYYVDKGIYEEGLNYYLEALKIKPEDSMIQANIAKVNFYLKNQSESEKIILNCLQKEPNNIDFKKTYAGFLFKTQDYKNAWKFYESRIWGQNFINENKFSKNINQFISNNNPIKKYKNILVIKEQGIGDEILYGTMYHNLLKEHNNVRIECSPKLLTYFEKQFVSKNKIFYPYGYFSSSIINLKQFEKIIYAGNLGGWYRNNKKDFNNNKIFINNIQNFEIEKMLKDTINTKRIGISWKSFREKKLYTEGKSIKLEDLLPIFNIPNFSFINLQYGDVKKEIDNFNNRFEKKIINFKSINIFNDLDSLSYILKKIDIFITVSNTTAHLAGALNVKTYMIKPQPHSSFHYWNQKNNKTPWYESITLFEKKNKIEKTINEIKSFLENSM